VQQHGVEGPPERLSTPLEEVEANAALGERLTVVDPGLLAQARIVDPLDHHADVHVLRPASRNPLRRPAS